MRTMLWVGMVIGALSMSGCAGQSHAKAITRLQSDMGLLDQRVSQLERASLQPPSAALWPESQPTSAATATEESSVKVAVAAPSASSAQYSKREIQQALKNAGFYNGPVDGKIGPLTQEAIRQFQQAHGLKTDGVVGTQTWEQLAPYATLSSDSGTPAAETLK